MPTYAYIGEHLLPGQIGHIALLASFVFAIASVLALLMGRRSNCAARQYTQQKIGITFFVLQGTALLASFILLVYIIFSHYFEYKYVWQHSSTSLPFKYLLSCIWEGQEGSFLLWGIWHWIIGIWIFKTKQAQAISVLFFMAIFQAIISSMLLGLRIGDIVIGSNPFILMREHFSDAPLFAQSNYTSLLVEGRGLNELLQNYWMVIHPPILFLGYALSIVPFAYACTALREKEFYHTIKNGLKWSLLAGAVLGLGIMLGGAWAYESLSFGGYWNWDPVENASLVPWLCIIAAIHACIITIRRKKAYMSSILLLGSGFIFVVYSSYLTRSGILGDTSVHSFTDLGLNYQLIAFLGTSFAILLYLFLKNRRTIPSSTHHKEDAVHSREFWISIGMMVLLVSAAYIILSTSLPVINKIFLQRWSIGVDVPYAYNRVLIFAAISITLLSSLAYMLHYKSTPKATLHKTWKKPLLIITAVAILWVCLVSFEYDKKGSFFRLNIYIAFFTSIVSLGTHLYYYLKFANKKQAGAILSHIGFAVLIVGILFSSANKEVISYNYSGFTQRLGKGSQENPMENITLIEGVPTPMPPYILTFLGDSISDSKKDPQTYFNILFRDNLSKEVFTLSPSAFITTKGEKSLLSNPDSRHYLLSDLFTYVTSMPDKTTIHQIDTNIRITYGDTLFLSLGYITLRPKGEGLQVQGKDKYLNDFSQYLQEKQFTSQKTILLKEVAANIMVLEKNASSIYLNVAEKENTSSSYITLKVYRFPHINLVWMGVLLLFIGFVLSWYARTKSRHA